MEDERTPTLLPEWWALLGALSKDDTVHEPYRRAAENAVKELARLWPIHGRALDVAMDSGAIGQTARYILTGKA